MKGRLSGGRFLQQSQGTYVNHNLKDASENECGLELL